MPSARLERVLRSLERRGLALDGRALALVEGHYARLKMDDLVELLETVAAIDRRARRIGQADALLAEWDRLAAVLGPPPEGTRELLADATRLGIAATTELLDAQGEGLYYDLPATRESEYMRHSAERLDGYWGEAMKEFRGKVQAVIVTGLERAQAPGEMVNALVKETKISRNRAKLILRNEVGTAQGHAMEMDQREMGYDRYTWSTSLDTRVRPEHQVREGKVYAWDDPPSDGHPGVPIMCRCVAIPVVA